MTILSELPTNEPDIDATTPDPGFGAKFNAAWRSETIRTDAWHYADRVRAELRNEVYDRLPFESKNRVFDHNARHHQDTVGLDRILMDEAGKARAAGDLKWQDLPASLEDLDHEVDRRRKAELDEAEDLLAIDGGGLAGFLGTGGRAMTDPTSLMMMPFGAGGSLARVMISETVLGAAGEAAVLPREFQVADELGLEKPNVAKRIGVGALFGGGLAGAFSGTGRLLTYGKQRRAALAEARPLDVNKLDFGEEVNAEYERLATDAQSDFPIGKPLQPDGSDSAQPLRKPDAVKVEYDLSVKVRNQPVSDDFLSRLRRVVAPLGDDINVTITSGGQDPAGTPAARRTGSTRHDVDHTGFAHTADLVLTRNGRFIRPSEDKELYARFFNRAAAKFPGLGHYSWGVHVGSGSVAAWGPTKTSRSLDPYFKEAIEAGRVGWTGWTPRSNRAAGTPANELNFQGYGTSRGYTGTGQILAGDDLRIDVEYQIVDLADLRQASGDLQPRDRGRVASDAWVSDTAARLDPAQLMPGPTADRGAPLVGTDGVIESGNGRVRAIERAYGQHPDRAEAYRRQIELTTGKSVPEAMDRPVLIAKRKTELDDAARRQMVVDAQDSGVARMNASERAQVGQRALTADLMASYQPGYKFSAAENRNFARGFSGAFPRSERNAFIGQDGRLSIDGARQLSDAMFARAYEAPDILARYVETEAGDLRSLMDALSDAAPHIAQLRAEIEAGLIRPEMDITPFLLDAARLIMTARDLAAREGSQAAKILEELLGDIDLLDGVVAPLTQALVRKMMPRGKQAPAAKIAGFLKRYVDEVRKAGRAGGALLDPPGPLDVLKAIDRDAFGGLVEVGTARIHAAPELQIDPEAIPGSAFAEGARSPEAQAADDLVVTQLSEPSEVPRADLGEVNNEIREAAEAFQTDGLELEIELPDGTSVSLREILDDLDADEVAETVINACTLGGTS